MDSVSLVRAIKEIRGSNYPAKKGTVGGLARRLASYGLLTQRQVASALGVSHTAVQRHLLGYSSEFDDTVPGNSNWDVVDLLLSYLTTNSDDEGVRLLLCEYGFNPKLLQHLLDSRESRA